MSPKIVYIRCHGHSGSTLLDFLLSSHEQVASVGEVVRIEIYPETRCTCGAHTVFDCPFWQEVERVLRQSADLGLRDLQVRGKNQPDFAAHNRALFAAVAEVSGCRVIVDSSKYRSRLRALLATPGLDLLPIHLVRDPRGVVLSNMRKGGSWLEHSRACAKTFRDTRDTLEGTDHLEVRYERLATDAEGVLTEVMGALGLDYRPDQLAWAGRERHNVGGNRMRSSTDSTIRLDERWKSQLSYGQRMGISLINLPSRLPGRLAYRLTRPLVMGEGWAGYSRMLRRAGRAHGAEGRSQ